MTNACSAHSSLTFSSRRGITGTRIISSCTSRGGRPDGRHRSLVDSTADRSTATCRPATDYFHTACWAPLASRRPFPPPRFQDGGGEREREDCGRSWTSCAPLPKRRSRPNFLAFRHIIRRKFSRTRRRRPSAIRTSVRSIVARRRAST